MDVSNLSVSHVDDAANIARAATVPYQDNVTGNSTTPGVVLVRFHDRL